MKICLLGSLDFLDQEFIDTAFYDQRLWAFGSKTKKLKHLVWLEQDQSLAGLGKTIAGFDFDLYFFFSKSLIFGQEALAEMELLQELSAYLGDSPFIYVLSNQNQCSNDLLISAASNYFQAVRILQIPNRIDLTHPKDLFKNLFDQNDSNVQSLLHSNQDQLDFIDDRDLARLLFQVLDSGEEKWHHLRVKSPFTFTYPQLLESMNENHSKSRKEEIVDQTHETLSRKSDDNNWVRHHLGWFAKIDPLEELGTYWTRYYEYKESKEASDPLSVLGKLEQETEWIKAVQVFVFFLTTQFLQVLASDYLNFRSIDFRLLYVLFMTMLYGQRLGGVAAFLASISLLWNQVAIYQDLTAIFYNTERWLPFILYFLIAIICGLLRMQEQDRLRELEFEALGMNQEKQLIHASYQQVREDLDLLEKEMLQRQDGFAHFYLIFRRLKGHKIKAKLVEVIKEEVASPKVSFVAHSPSMPEEDVWVNQILDKEKPAMLLRWSPEEWLQIDGLKWDQMNSYVANRLALILKLAKDLSQEDGQ